MEKVTNKLIESHNPCKEGILDFNTKYPKYNDKLSNLLRLEDISYDDKIWLCYKVVDIKILQQWSVECAESVVHIYNDLYLNDTRMSDCIETTKLYLEGKCGLYELKSAMLAARLAESVSESAAESAAESVRSAAWSVSESVRSVGSAVWSAESAAWSVRSVTRSDQETINLSILIALLENS